MSNLEITAKRKYSLLERLLFPSKKLNLSKLQQVLKDKIILITGASYGIGEQLAYLLAFKNTKLILVGRTTDKLNVVKNRIETLGGTSEIFPADLQDNSQLDELIKYLTARENGVDVFVSNAGKSIKRSIFESLNRYHDFERSMSINFNAPVKLCLALIPILEKNKGHIINVSALNVLLPAMPKWSAYQSSKSAFNQWFNSVSFELNATHIATSTLYLPLVKTRMIKPTKAYNNMPAMKPEHVAKIICKLIINKKKTFKPWWLIFVETVAFLLSKSLKGIITFMYKKEKNV